MENGFVSLPTHATFFTHISAAIPVAIFFVISFICVVRERFSSTYTPSCQCSSLPNLFGVLVLGWRISHCQKLGTRCRLCVRTKAIMAANSYKKMYGDNGSSVPDSKHVKCCVTFASGLNMAN